jgi:uncharacterized protein YdcH (DUF465 family)
MNRLDHLALKHKLLDDQIDAMEKRSQHPLPQEKRMIAELKKERLKVKDQIVKTKIEDMHGQSRT